MLAAFLWPLSAAAYLGGFEEQDGYRIPSDGQILSAFLPGDAQFYLNNIDVNGYTGYVPVGAFPNTFGDSTHGADLSRYNAGDYGTNNSGPGGTAADIADNSGLWHALAGGRLNEDVDAPYYNGNTFTRDYVHAYRYPGAHTGTSVLNFLASETNLSYSYTLDSRDLDGTAPSSTLASLIQMAFWLCPSDWDDPDTDNVMGVSLRDSMNQAVFEVGYTGDNRLQYRLPGGGAWQTTGFLMGSTGWSQLVVSLDTANNLASLAVSAYSDGSSSLGALTDVISNQSLGMDADALTGLQWDLRGGTLNNGAASFKNYFDDFTFAVSPVLVPEPGSLWLACLAATALLLPRKRRQLA